MRTLINKILIFAAGVVIGSAVTWKCIKDKYKKLADEEIASVKEIWSKKHPTVEDITEACVNEGMDVDITVQPKQRMSIMQKANSQRDYFRIQIFR